MKVLKTLLKNDKQLLQELFSSLEEIMSRRHKGLSQIRFAKPAKHGWVFLNHISDSMDVLEEVMHRVLKQHRHYKAGKVAELLSRLVNLSEEEFISLRSAVL